MKNFNNAFFFVLALLCLNSCGKDDDTTTPTPDPGPKTYTLIPDANIQDELQEILITMENGEVIEFAEGTYNFTNTVSMVLKDCITIRGAGRDKTFLNFAGQTAGAEALKFSETNDILLEKFTVLDAAGDAIKVKDSDGITMIEVGTEWTGEPKQENGAYGIYPVSSRNILLDNCYARGASDAGIYVGQSEYIHVKNCVAEENVAGIEVENCNYAEVYNCRAEGNTGGILIFDLPNLVLKNGTHCRIYDNELVQNDLRNFAPEGNIVANVPSGTGIMLMTSKNVEVFNNTFTNNNTMALGIVNYPVLQYFDSSLTIDDDEYDPFIENISVHDNTFARTTEYPAEQNGIGITIQGLFPDGDAPDILFDGVINPNNPDDPSQTICINNNGDAGFSNLDAENFFAGLNYDIAPHLCSHDPLTVVEIDVAPCE